jgi:hypothetical protein
LSPLTGEFTCTIPLSSATLVSATIAHDSAEEEISLTSIPSINMADTHVTTLPAASPLTGIELLIPGEFGSANILQVSVLFQPSSVSCNVKAVSPNAIVCVLDGSVAAPSFVVASVRLNGTCSGAIVTSSPAIVALIEHETRNSYIL